MRYGLIILAITVFMIYNTYHDGIYLKKLYSYKKQYTMIMYGFIGLCAYLFIKKHPNESNSMMVYANDIVKYMPIDKESMDLMSPLLDLTTKGIGVNLNKEDTPQFKRMMNSGGNNYARQNTVKRSVSETKKNMLLLNKIGNVVIVVFNYQHGLR